MQEQHEAQEQQRQEEQQRQQEQQQQQQQQPQPQHEERWPFCPLCLQEIRLVLPCQAGGEVEQYWRWIHEVSPGLVAHFDLLTDRETDDD